MKVNIPTTFIIFGATGALSQRKLFPALFDLYRKSLLPDKFHILAFSRQELDTASFAAIVEKNISDGEEKSHFLGHIEFFKGDYSKDSFLHLADRIKAIEDRYGQCANKLYHLAVPPDAFEDIFMLISAAELSRPCSDTEGWARILVEKPFGKDSATAERLDRLLGELFREEQVYRIDHYLAKEALQNILAFRAYNPMFMPLWNKDHIEKVEIELFETGTAEGRAGFYDSIGALRDVGQNHMLQMAALVGMEVPLTLETEPIRAGRQAVLEALSPKTWQKITSHASRGQYEGYTADVRVSESETETYFELTVFIDSKRWKNVPFILKSGKALAEDKAEIKIFFKKDGAGKQNILRFRIQPDEAIRVLFWFKKPGFDRTIESKELTFKYHDSTEAQKLPDAYERVLHDCVNGDQTLFASTGEVMASWKFITPVIQAWQSLPLHVYKKGSEGPNSES
ncbi:MAG: glucose-6-phosphate dehydrogenase [bacterium]|nr:glucose-6-phosphate dehydrogenase [bacterium]